jgi:hypothetical protein
MTNIRTADNRTDPASPPAHRERLADVANVSLAYEPHTGAVDAVARQRVEGLPFQAGIDFGDA